MKKTIVPPKPSNPRGWVQQAAKYLVRGILGGMLFEGTFLMFSFENRIIRSVTSNRLQEIKALEEETARKIRKGQKPLIGSSLLVDKQIKQRQQIGKSINEG